MSAFKNGDIVKTRTDIFGRVQAYRPELHPTQPTKNPGKSGPPGSEIDEPVRIPKGKIGEVLYSDEIDTIAMFPIHETGRLEPHLVKAQGFTKDFQRVVRDPEKHPFVQLKPRKLKNPQKPLEEPEKEIMGEIIDVSPVKKFLGKWNKISEPMKLKGQNLNDPLDWEGGQGPHASLLEAQDIEFLKLSPEDQKKAVVNALRVGILSPMKDLSHNAIHYQDIADVHPDESDVNVYLEHLGMTREEWNKQRDIYHRKHPFGMKEEQGMLFGDESYDMPEKEELYWQRYPGFIHGHLDSIASLGSAADSLTNLAKKDFQQTGGTGQLWREGLRNFNISGVNNKVASFAWLLIAPKSSELATVDRHMMNFLGRPDFVPSTDKQYDQYESQLKEVKSQYPGYENMPLGAFQWGVWDNVRTGPGTHQLHDSLKPIGFTPYWKTKWEKRVKKPRQTAPQPIETPANQMTIAKQWRKVNELF